MFQIYWAKIIRSLALLSGPELQATLGQGGFGLGGLPARLAVDNRSCCQDANC